MISKAPSDPSRIAKLLQLAPAIRGALARDSGVEGKPHRVVLALMDKVAEKAITLETDDVQEIAAALKGLSSVAAVTVAGLGTFGVGGTRAEAVVAADGSRKGDLTGQVAVVTGGAGGLGLSVAELLREQGAEIALMDIAEGPVTEAARRLGGIGLACDVTNPASVDAAIAQVVAQYGGIDILISNAGAALQGALLELDRLLTEARLLLAECRPVIERAQWVFTPPKGTCVWGAPERDALLARLDAALGGEA
jgi:hypothetical protein